MLEDFRGNLQVYINQQQFNEVVSTIFGLIGNILSRYCDGKYIILGKIKLPPLAGIEKDMLELFHDNSM